MLPVENRMLEAYELHKGGQRQYGPAYSSSSRRSRIEGAVEGAPKSTSGTPSAPEGGREGLVIISGEKSGPKSIIRPDTMVDLSQDNSAEEIRKNQKSQDKNVRKNDNSRPNSSQVAPNSLLAVSNSKSLSNGTRLCDSSSLLTSAAPKSGLVSFLGSNPTPSKPPGHSNAPMSTTGTPSAPEGGREGLVIISGEKSGPRNAVDTNDEVGGMDIHSRRLRFWDRSYS